MDDIVINTFCLWNFFVSCLQALINSSTVKRYYKAISQVQIQIPGFHLCILTTFALEQEFTFDIYILYFQKSMYVNVNIQRERERKRERERERERELIRIIFGLCKKKMK